LIEHFQDNELADFISAQGCLFGEVGKDLRFIGMFSNSEKEVLRHDLERVDKEINYNGDHSFLKSHPEFNVSSPSKDNVELT
jgi:hypothetical protein